MRHIDAQGTKTNIILLIAMLSFLLSNPTFSSPQQPPMLSVKIEKSGNCGEIKRGLESTLRIDIRNNSPEKCFLFLSINRGRMFFQFSHFPTSTTLSPGEKTSLRVTCRPTTEGLIHGFATIECLPSGKGLKKTAAIEKFSLSMTGVK